MESAPSNKHEQQDSFFTAELVDKTKDALSKQLHTEWRDGIRTGFEANDQSPDTPRLRASKDSTGEADAEWFAEQEAAGVEFPTDDKGNNEDGYLQLAGAGQVVQHCADAPGQGIQCAESH